MVRYKWSDTNGVLGETLVRELKSGEFRFQVFAVVILKLKNTTLETILFCTVQSPSLTSNASEQALLWSTWISSA